MTLETNFPRGGRKISSDRSHLKTPTGDTEDLFKVLKSQRKPSKASKSSKKKRKEDFNQDNSEETVVIENLTSKTLLSDMIILGCLREVGDYGLNVSLPGGLTGKVPVTNISNEYTDLLQRYSQDPQTLQEHISTLSSMYEVGTCLPVRVIAHSTDSAKPKTTTTLSIKPTDVNRDIVPNSVFHGMLLLCSVKSVEDHGYLMDVGFGNLQGFLSSSESRSLCVGQTILCSVNMPNLSSSTPRVLNLTVKKKVLANILDLDETQVSLNGLLPGSRIQSMIIETKKNGLIAKCSQFLGCVYKDHLKNVFDKPANYEVAKTMVGTVLYVHPITNHLHLSFADKLTPKSLKNVFPDIKYGDIIEDATVIGVTKTRVYFQINNKVKGLAKLNNMNEGDHNIDNASDVFNIGDKHRCRIIGFNYIDKLVMLSLKSYTFQQILLDKDDIQVGKVFTGIVDQHVKQGVKVKLGQGSFGIVPYLHLSDHEILNPSRHFPPGSKVQCRVLRVDQVGNYVSPLLTCKRTLVFSKLKPLTSYEEAEVGALHHGVVVQANSSGLLLSFYNDVKGWVAVQELSEEYIQYPEKTFYNGQVVKASVLRCKPEESKLYFSLKLDTKKPFGQKDMAAGKMLKSGDLISAKVVKKSSEGLDVLIFPEGVKGFLPVNHLSDHPRLCKLYLDLYDVNDIISSALCFSTKGTIIVSKKKMFCEAAGSGNFTQSWQNLHRGQLIPGVVKTFLNYGIIVDFGRSICGLVNIKCLVDGRVKDPRSVGFTTHQSVITRVLDVNPDTHRMALSTKLSDVCELSSDQDPSILWLHNFLSDWEELCSLHVNKGSLRGLADMKIGSIVQVTIKSISAEGILCETDEGVPGIITNNNIGEYEPKLNTNTEAVVLHVDLRNNCAELSISPSLVNDSKHLKTTVKSKMDNILGQTVSGTVLLIRTHFVLVCLHEPACGMLAYVPVFRHPNDLVGFSYKTGDSIQVVVKKICKQYIICLKVNEDLHATKRKNQADTDVSCVKRQKMVSHSSDYQMDSSEIPSPSISLNKYETCHGVVTQIDKKGITVKLDSGTLGILKRGKVKQKLGHILPVGAEVTVRKAGRKDSSPNLQLVSVLQIPDGGTNKELHTSRLQSASGLKRSGFEGSVGTITNFNKNDVFVKLESGTFGVLKQSDIKYKIGQDLPSGTKVKVRQLGSSDFPVKLSFVDVVQKLENENSACSSVRQQQSIRRDSSENQITFESDPSEITRRKNHTAPEHGIITNFNHKHFFVKISSGGRGMFPRKSVRSVSQLEQLNSGTEVKVKIVKSSDDLLELRLCDIVQSPHAKQKSINTDNVQFKPCFVNNESFEESDTEALQDTVAKVGLAKFSVPITSGADTNMMDHLQVPGSLCWDVEATPNLNLLGENQVVDSDSSDNENHSEAKKVSSNVKDKNKKLKQDEEFLSKQEQRLMDSGREPETVDDFDRLVLSQPDNSVIWLKYMSFHLQQAEVDKARAVAQKALNTISFREEQEKLNIWFALLNLENLYGTNESLEATFQKAIQFNDPFKIYMHLAKIYIESEKNEEAETLFTVMIRKFKGQPQTWLSYALHCLKIGKNNRASDLFQQCLASLDKRHHVEVVSKFAQLEFKHGESERGKTMMESLLASYPKRTDLWSQYSDFLIKNGDVQGTRQVLERATSLNLPARRMKFLFKKYLEFEKKHGSEEFLEKVKQKAIDYVQSRPE